MKKDDTSAHTRLQLLWEVLRTRWLLLLGCSALVLLFALPLAAAGFVTEYSKAMGLQTLLQSGSTDGLELCIHCFGWNFVGLLLNCLCGAAAAIALSGVGRVVQLLALERGVVFRQDFALGIKENYKFFLTATVFACCAVFAVQCNLDLVRYSGETPVLLVISTVLTTLAAFLLAATGTYIAAQSLRYQLTLGDSVKNGLILTIACFPQSLALMAMLAGPFGIACLFGIAGRLVYLLVMGLMGFGLSLLAAVLLCGEVFEKTINTQVSDPPRPEETP